MDYLFAPAWAGGWTLCRWMFGVAALWGHVPHLAQLADAYACSDMLFTNGPYRLTEWIVWRPPTATALWAVGLVGIGMFTWGGRLTRPGLLLYLLGAWSLLGEEAINVKAHDRLGLWIAVALCFSPAGERSLTNKFRSPSARWFLIIIFFWLYASTGSLKLVQEPGWRDGTALQYSLLHQFHAGGTLAIWLSTQPALCRVLGWCTVGFELGFPLLVGWRRTNPWILACGVGFHLGILAMMNVGAFSLVALSAYPVLLHPDAGRALWERRRALRGFGD